MGPSNQGMTVLEWANVLLQPYRNQTKGCSNAQNDMKLNSPCRHVRAAGVPEEGDDSGGAHKIYKINTFL